MEAKKSLRFVTEPEELLRFTEFPVRTGSGRQKSDGSRLPPEPPARILPAAAPLRPAASSCAADGPPGLPHGSRR